MLIVLSQEILGYFVILQTLLGILFSFLWLLLQIQILQKTWLVLPGMKKISGNVKIFTLFCYSRKESNSSVQKHNECHCCVHSGKLVFIVLPILYLRKMRSTVMFMLTCLHCKVKHLICLYFTPFPWFSCTVWVLTSFSIPSFGETVSELRINICIMKHKCL